MNAFQTLIVSLLSTLLNANYSPSLKNELSNVEIAKNIELQPNDSLLRIISDSFAGNLIKITHSHGDNHLGIADTLKILLKNKSIDFPDAKHIEEIVLPLEPEATDFSAVIVKPAPKKISSPYLVITGHKTFAFGIYNNITRVNTIYLLRIKDSHLELEYDFSGYGLPYFDTSRGLLMIYEHQMLLPSASNPNALQLKLLYCFYKKRAKLQSLILTDKDKELRNFPAPGEPGESTFYQNIALRIK